MRTFESYVVRGVIFNNEFGIETVEGLTSLKSMHFDKASYSTIVELIVAGDLDAISDIDIIQKSFEHLEIMLFMDQTKMKYIVTVYSTDALENDPQIIEVFPLKK